MTKTGGGWQFLRDYTVIYVCLEGETERVIKCKSKKEHLVHKGFRICKFTEQLLIIGSMDGLRASENSIQIHVWFLHVNIHISEASVHNFHQDKKKSVCPGQVTQLVGMSWKSCMFDPRLEHVWEAFRLMFLSHIDVSLSVSLKSINISLGEDFKKGCEKKEKQKSGW